MCGAVSGLIDFCGNDCLHGDTYEDCDNTELLRGDPDTKVLS